MRILLLGVVSGPSGVEAVKTRLPAARAAGGFDLVVACADFARGRTPYDEPSLRALFAAGVDYLVPAVNACSDRLRAAIDAAGGRIVPPANHPLFRDDPRCEPLLGPPGAPFALLNVGGVEGLFSALGSETLTPLDSPYAALERLLPRHAGRPPLVLFFSHSTPEKEALAAWLDGRALAVAGFGALAATDDAGPMPLATAYVTDLGVVGTRLVHAPPAERPADPVYRTLLPAKHPPLGGAPPLAGLSATLADPPGAPRRLTFDPWRELTPDDDIGRRLEELSRLHEVSRLIAESSSDLDTLLDTVMTVATRLMRSETSSILLVDERTGDLTFRIAQGPKGDAAKRLVRLKMGQGIAGHCAATGESVVVPDCAADPRFYVDGDRLTEFTTRSLIAVPLVFREKVIGVLEVLNRRGPVPFDARDTAFLELVSRLAAGPIVNARLHDKTRNFYRSTLKVLANALDAKDTYTHGHSQRVALYAVAMAQELSLPDAVRDDLEFASLLHDIGKIGIRDAILCKPGKLTGPEFDIVRMHPVLSAKILEPIEFLAELIPVVRHHHERYDGTGYPDGLAGEAIPLGARIIAVADAFDAMTSDRAYRRPRKAPDALAEIRRCAGAQFDPRVAEAFCRTFERDFASLFDDMQSAFARQDPVADLDAT